MSRRSPMIVAAAATTLYSSTMIQPGTTQVRSWASASGVRRFMLLYDAAFLSVGALTVLQAMPTVASPLARRADSGRPRHASP